MSPLLATVVSGSIELRPIRGRDASEWRELRAGSADWLGPWEATSPSGPGDAPRSFPSMVRALRAEAKAGRTIPWVIRCAGALAGQMTISGLAYGSLRSANAGYWVGREFAGRGIAPSALALATDYCFGALGMHRMEINIRPENRASLRVVEKLGFRYEGVRVRYLHIDGDWRDHLSFALTSEEVPAGVVSRWKAAQVAG